MELDAKTMSEEVNGSSVPVDSNRAEELDRYTSHAGREFVEGNMMDPRTVIDNSSNGRHMLHTTDDANEIIGSNDDAPLKSDTTSVGAVIH